MSFFDNEYEVFQRLLQTGVEESHETGVMRVDVKRALQRLDRLELLCEAMAALGETKKLFTRTELVVMMTRIDLLDGVEDGRRRELRSNAPKCASCNHHVNPRRRDCVYCGASLVAEEASSPYRGGGARPHEELVLPKMVDCTSCRTSVEQADAYFSKNGELVCLQCMYAGR